MASLARKYRPDSFKDLTGQIHTARALKNALEFNKLNHAYLFFGSRGVGKTSTARILARCINCQKNGISTNPCGVCDNCIEIAEGRNIDVIEMDAASNRGIEHIRDLRENVRFAPMKSRYKIYIIDEVHMLTTEAFNALLKTLEEQQEHVIFIMATTEYHKIPETILSRCQAFPFKKFSNLEISERLAYIMEQEKIEYDKEGLIPIAVKGEGSMRDSISLLDRIITYSGKQKITYELVNEVLGIIPAQLYLEFLDGIVSKNLKKCLEIINDLYYNGYNLKVFFYDYLGFLKNVTLIKKDVYKDTGYFTSGQIQEIRNSVKNRDEEELLLTFDICYKMYNNWTYYNTTKSFEILLNIEMALVEIMDKLSKPSVSALLRKISQLEKAITEGKPFEDKVTPAPVPSPVAVPSQKNDTTQKIQTAPIPVQKSEPKPNVQIQSQVPSAEVNDIDDDIGTMIQKEFGAAEENSDSNLKIFPDA